VIARMLDALLGPRCPLNCGQRVYVAKDQTQHNHHYHRGDPRLGQTQGETA
jgi:hypothetical protein